MRQTTELPFSPAFDFVWLRECTLNGQPVKAGDPVDKTQIDERRLRVLFQTRRIAPAGFAGPAPAYLENGRGKADALARELAAEEKGEGGDGDTGASVPAETVDADAPQPPAAPEPAAAKTVERRAPAGGKSGKSRTGAKRSKRAA